MDSTKTKRSILSTIFKTPLTYVFASYGIALGNAIGLSVNTSTPEQAGYTVMICILISSCIFSFIGYSVSVGVNSITSNKAGNIALKIVAAIVGFFLYSLILGLIQHSAS